MRLTKHHGIGNDFLVLVDLDGAHPLDPDTVRTLCDRHTGIGADGMLRATRGTGGAVARMELFNADGSRAEMSGNGIGCLVHGLLLAGAASGSTIAIDTDAGRRAVDVTPSPEAGAITIAVDMGDAKIADAAEWVGDDVTHAAFVDVGNPHLVFYVPDPVWSPDLTERGCAINEKVPGGVNVEVITHGPGADELTMDVYERGVGITRACGTGACAAAAAAHRWGEVGPSVVVHMVGGDARVDLGRAVRYFVDIHHIATVEVA